MRFIVTVGLLVVGLVGVFLSGAGQSVGGDKADAPQMWPLEGELKIHPKYMYRYYITFGDGQKCALYARDHEREIDQLARLQPGARVRVRGVLGTEYFPGGTKKNPSPFPPAWTLYMDVNEVENLK